ncbi:MAG: 16S rRNA (adenine(1518)-N(6)/adenine(1519)-N(6))-dimethyltransferase RsmA [Lentisphaeria bacterium]|jgi:16S rRNA (adenine1518-N6/adenine1519-N6)-dimethyltransferase
MTRGELLDILRRLGVNPSRRLGQNFLADPNLLDWMLRTAAPQAGERVLEVGPGSGVLTRKLLAAGVELTAVELDHRLAAHLRATLGAAPNFRLVEGDACRQDYGALMGEDTPWRCIANLPYAVSSVLLAGFLDLRNPPRELYILLQLEMAQRLRAGPGTKDYGALTVQVQLDYAVEILRRVPPGVFFPPPEVDSAYVRLARPGERLPGGVRTLARELARLGFSQRRKQFRKLLASRFPTERLDAAFAALGLGAAVRAEALPVATFVRLAEALAAGDAPP